eukprot:augustus_masked-scaffold_16-processed-gene-0.53-mRNA-1 protein AED:1.00 eAED:1.00 QI:0/-1/0/0/-1/1/1/0/1495
MKENSDELKDMLRRNALADWEKRGFDRSLFDIGKMLDIWNQEEKEKVSSNFRRKVALKEKIDMIEVSKEADLGIKIDMERMKNKIREQKRKLVKSGTTLYEKGRKKILPQSLLLKEEWKKYEAEVSKYNKMFTDDIDDRNLYITDYHKFKRYLEEQQQLLKKLLAEKELKDEVKLRKIRELREKTVLQEKLKRNQQILFRIRRRIVHEEVVAHYKKKQKKLLIQKNRKNYAEERYFEEVRKPIVRDNTVLENLNVGDKSLISPYVKTLDLTQKYLHAEFSEDYSTLYAKEGVDSFLFNPEDIVFQRDQAHRILQKLESIKTKFLTEFKEVEDKVNGLEQTIKLVSETYDYLVTVEEDTKLRCERYKIQYYARKPTRVGVSELQFGRDLFRYNFQIKRKATQIKKYLSECSLELDRLNERKLQVKKNSKNATEVEKSFRDKLDEEEQVVLPFIRGRKINLISNSLEEVLAESRAVLIKEKVQEMNYLHKRIRDYSDDVMECSLQRKDEEEDLEILRDMVEDLKRKKQKAVVIELFSLMAKGIEIFKYRNFKRNKDKPSPFLLAKDMDPNKPQYEFPWYLPRNERFDDKKEFFSVSEENYTCINSDCVKPSSTFPKKFYFKGSLKLPQYALWTLRSTIKFCKCLDESVNRTNTIQRAELRIKVYYGTSMHSLVLESTSSFVLNTAAEVKLLFHFCSNCIFYKMEFLFINLPSSLKQRHNVVFAFAKNLQLNQIMLYRRKLENRSAYGKKLFISSYVLRERIEDKQRRQADMLSKIIIEMSKAREACTPYIDSTVFSTYPQRFLISNYRRLLKNEAKKIQGHINASSKGWLIQNELKAKLKESMKQYLVRKSFSFEKQALVDGSKQLVGHRVEYYNKDTLQWKIASVDTYKLWYSENEKRWMVLHILGSLGSQRPSTASSEQMDATLKSNQYYLNLFTTDFIVLHESSSLQKNSPRLKKDIPLGTFKEYCKETIDTYISKKEQLQNIKSAVSNVEEKIEHLKLELDQGSTNEFLATAKHDADTFSSRNGDMVLNAVWSHERFTTLSEEVTQVTNQKGGAESISKSVLSEMANNVFIEEYIAKSNKLREKEMKLQLDLENSRLKLLRFKAKSLSYAIINIRKKAVKKKYDYSILKSTLCSRTIKNQLKPFYFTENEKNDLQPFTSCLKNSSKKVSSHLVPYTCEHAQVKFGGTEYRPTMICKVCNLDISYLKISTGERQDPYLFSRTPLTLIRDKGSDQSIKTRQLSSNRDLTEYYLQEFYGFLKVQDENSLFERLESLPEENRIFGRVYASKKRRAILEKNIALKSDELVKVKQCFAVSNSLARKHNSLHVALLDEVDVLRSNLLKEKNLIIRMNELRTLTKRTKKKLELVSLFFQRVETWVNALESRVKPLNEWLDDVLDTVNTLKTSVNGLKNEYKTLFSRLNLGNLVIDEAWKKAEVYFLEKEFYRAALMPKKIFTKFPLFCKSPWQAVVTKVRYSWIELTEQGELFHPVYLLSN